jgi:GGDEF domain-containing protein
VAELICDQVNHEPVHIQVSIGISIYDPAEEFNNLLGEAPHQTMKKYSRRADLAMYQAKQAGRNQTKCWRE